MGLYLAPPNHALVLCCDEKSEIQALDRTQPPLSLKPGRCGTMTHDYKRHGSTTLFAAMEMAEGKHVSAYSPRHRHQEYGSGFRVDRPADTGGSGSAFGCGLLRYTLASEVRALAKESSPLPYSLSPHGQLIAHHGGTVVPEDHRRTDSARYHRLWQSHIGFIDSAINAKQNKNTRITDSGSLSQESIRASNSGDNCRSAVAESCRGSSAGNLWESFRASRGSF